MGKKQKARLEAAVANAGPALASNDVSLLERAASELLLAIVDDFDHARTLGASQLHDRMAARLEQLIVATLHRTLTACPCCKGTELLVSKRTGSVDLGAANLTVMLVVCRACGDVRLRCDDPAAVAEATVMSLSDLKLFRSITLPARDAAPFR
jgi:hypothetical protein